MEIHARINQLTDEEREYIWSLFNEKSRKKEHGQEVSSNQIREELHKYIHIVTEENNKLTAIEQINDTFMTTIEAILQCLLQPKCIRAFDLDKERIEVLLGQIINKRSELEQDYVWDEAFCMAIMVRLGLVFNESKEKIENSPCSSVEIIKNFSYVNNKIVQILNKHIICCCGYICEKDSDTHRRLKNRREKLSNDKIKEMFKKGGLYLIQKLVPIYLFKGILIPVAGALVIGAPIYLKVTSTNEWKEADRIVWINAKKQFALAMVLYQHSYTEIHKDDMMWGA